MTRKEALDILMSANVWNDEERTAWEVLVPELAESEDERIRKTLVEYFGPQAQLDFVRGVPIQKIRVWLEKQKEPENTSASTMAPSCWEVEQKEQKPISFNVPFNPDDYEVVMQGNATGLKQKENPKSADSIPADCVSDAKCEDRDSNYGVFPEDVIVVARACEKLKAHGYTELAHALKNVNLYTKEQKPVKVGENAYFDPNTEMWFIKKEQKPAELNEEFVERLMDCMCAAQQYRTGTISWDVVKGWAEELNELKKPAEWSEEDEDMLNSCISSIEEAKENRYAYKETDGDTSYDHEIDWLKSLRPQYHGDVTMTEAYKMGLEAGRAQEEAEKFFDSAQSYHEGFVAGQKQKENPKSADSIPSDCASDAKCEDRWHKVSDSLPDNGRLVLANDCLGNTLLARYDGEGNWEVSVYDNEDYYCRNTITKWCEIPSEKQKEQKPCWNPTEEDVALFNKAITTNASLSPQERAKLDIIRMKFKHRPVIEQKEQKPVSFSCGHENDKPAWSEEDEENLNSIISCLNRSLDGVIDTVEITNVVGEIAWLKSLRNRPTKSDTWKPSEEQMKAFEDAMSYIPEFYKPKSNLASLLRDLNKLM